jgi:glycosyltransferase involved in cell wall biosynthesis
MFCHRMSQRPPTIVGVTIGDPFDPLSWSGSNYHLFTSLKAKGALKGAVDARSPILDRLEKLGSYERDRELWLQRYFAGASRLRAPARVAMSRLGARRAGAIDPRPDALLQVGAYYDFSAASAIKPRLLCSYHDGNIATYMHRDDLLLDADASYIRSVHAYERRVYDALDLIMCRTEWLRNSFIEAFGQEPAKVVNVGSGANLHAVPDAVERNFHDTRWLFVGKDFVRKGGPQVLDAFERVRAAEPEAELWIVGPRENPSTQPGVRFFGRIDRSDPEGEALMVKLYEEATGFVMAPFYEPSASVFLEAMGYGLPCIGSTFGAIPEFVADGTTGYLVSPGDADQLAERMIEVSSNPADAKAMGEAGRERFLRDFTWDAVGSRILDAIVARLPDS